MSIKPMLTLRQAAKRMGLTSSTMLRNYALKGRIPGAVRDPVSGWWLVPADFKVMKPTRASPRLPPASAPKD